jgi:hypothetical protein
LRNRSDGAPIEKIFFKVHTGDRIIKNPCFENPGPNEDDIFAIVIYFNENTVFTSVYLANVIFKVL